jgi:ABC-type uncharacterized transport system involved in gliding motility auxiliary subunit
MKSLAANQKYLKYLSLPGLAMITAGLLAGIIAGWTPLPTGLLLGGIGLLILGLGFSEYGRGRFWSQRSTEAGANALVATLAVLVILGLVNFLGVRYATRVDVTENQIFTLAPESRQVVQNLAAPAEVVIFDTLPNPQDQQLLNSYQRAGDQFSYSYVNPTTIRARLSPSALPRQVWCFSTRGKTRDCCRLSAPTSGCRNG